MHPPLLIHASPAPLCEHPASQLLFLSTAAGLPIPAPNRFPYLSLFPYHLTLPPATHTWLTRHSAVLRGCGAFVSSLAAPLSLPTSSRYTLSLSACLLLQLWLISYPRMLLLHAGGCKERTEQTRTELTSETGGQSPPVMGGGVLTWLLSGQVDPDDVLTKEEQIYLLVEAKEKCQRDIKAQLEKIKGSILTLRIGGQSRVYVTEKAVPSDGSRTGPGGHKAPGDHRVLEWGCAAPGCN